MIITPRTFAIKPIACLDKRCGNTNIAARSLSEHDREHGESIGSWHMDTEMTCDLINLSNEQCNSCMHITELVDNDIS